MTPSDLHGERYKFIVLSFQHVARYQKTNILTSRVPDLTNHLGGVCYKGTGTKMSKIQNLMSFYVCLIHYTFVHLEDPCTKVFTRIYKKAYGGAIVTMPQQG